MDGDIISGSVYHLSNSRRGKEMERDGEDVYTREINP